jgi:hypothetical protein
MQSHKLRSDIPAPPKFMQQLSIDERGYPVPWFVEWVNGKPEFRAMDGRKFVRAIKERLCWVCGNPLNGQMVFVIGPMCAVNRINAEPPCHRDCARYSAAACPFLSKPQMIRRRFGEDVAITMHESSIERNPGVTALWFARRFELVEIPTGILFHMGPPFHVEWYCRGRVATREEILHSINTGLPLLDATCDQDDDPAAARAALQACYKRALRLLPAA